MKFRQVTRSDMSHTVTVCISRRNGANEAMILPAGGVYGKGADPAASARGKTFAVPEALEDAKAMLLERPGLLEVVVQLSEGTEWDPAWGELI